MPWPTIIWWSCWKQEGAEAVVPDLMDFVYYTLYNQNYKTEYLGKPAGRAWYTTACGGLRSMFASPATEALKASSALSRPCPLSRLRSWPSPSCPWATSTGKAGSSAAKWRSCWSTACPNIVCIQPFGCLPNHVVGKGVIKQLKLTYPQANIAAVDYDPGASEVNQLNRIKLMLSSAKKNLEKEAAQGEDA